MKYWLLISFVFVSVVYASVKFQTGMVGTTRLSGGDGCLCHNLSPDPNVMVSVEGPDSLAFGQTAVYTVRISGGPAVVGGFNVAARFGSLNVADSNTQKIDGELTHSFPRPFINNQVSWQFNYTAGTSLQMDTIFSTALSANGDELPSGGNDKWNFGQDKIISILPVVPVELSSFVATLSQGIVNLTWTTASETNNKGFEVERLSSSHWITIGFVSGKGTTASANNYSFSDNTSIGFPVTGVISYRLRQIDYDGSFTYSDIENVNLTPAGFSLYQNYPNPFNPSTKIKFSLPSENYVTLKVYNISGEEIEVLLNEKISAGVHEINFNAPLLPAGVYFYRLTSDNFSGVKKFILLK
jgi:hypothetical protein